MDQQIGAFAAITARSGAATVLQLAGELDIATAADLVSVLERLTVEDPPVLVVDARDLLFIDSCGLRTLIDFAQTRGGEIVVVPSTAVRKTVELAALGGPLHLVGSIDEGVTHLDGLAPT